MESGEKTSAALPEIAVNLAWDKLSQKEEQFFSTLEEKLKIIKINDPNGTGSMNFISASKAEALEALQNKLFEEICGIIMVLSIQDSVSSALDLEKQLRQKNKNTYLIARPFERQNLNRNFEIYFGIEQTTTCNYEVNIVVTKKTNFYFSEMKKYSGSSIEENQEKLKTGGFLHTHKIKSLNKDINSLYGMNEVLKLV